MKKITQGAPRRRLGGHDPAPSIQFLRIRAPSAAPFRARVPCTKVLGRKGYWKKGKLAISKRKQGYFKGSNTPKGQRPGEFSDLILVKRFQNHVSAFSIRQFLICLWLSNFFNRILMPMSHIAFLVSLRGNFSRFHAFGIPPGAIFQSFMLSVSLQGHFFNFC